jgi:hygromycin-B 7''-O-kinase
VESLSERLGPLSDAQLQAALDRFELGALRRTERVEGGLFGQNLFVSSSTGEWVLRGAPHADWQLPRERYFAQQLHATTRVPVPWPYLLEESKDIFGWSFALIPRLPGKRPDAIGGLTPAERCDVARALGAGLAEAQRLTSNAPGELDAGREVVVPETSFRGWVLRTLAELRERIEALPGGFDTADRELIDRVVEESVGALDEPFVPCFVHFDFAPGNCHVERAAGGWRLSGLFDLMTCAFADGEQDLSRMTALLSRPEPETAKAFLNAYRERCPLRPGYRQRFRIYMLMDRLVLWEYGRRDGGWFPEDARFRRFARRFLALDELLDAG